MTRVLKIDSREWRKVIAMVLLMILSNDKMKCFISIKLCQRENFRSVLQTIRFIIRLNSHFISLLLTYNRNDNRMFPLQLVCVIIIWNKAQHGFSWFWSELLCFQFIGVWINTYVFYQSILEKKTWSANLVIVFFNL